MLPDQSSGITLPSVVTVPEDPILREAPWPERRWPGGLRHRPPVGSSKTGYYARNWAQAVALEKVSTRERRRCLPELARLLCLAEATTTGRFAVIRCRRRIWPVVRWLLNV